MYLLLNSNVMTNEGCYICNKISKDEFLNLLITAYLDKNLKNYIGYEQNLKLIYEWSYGIVNLEINRELTELQDGDIMLIMKLKYRVQTPSDKGKNVNENDFEFYKILYNKEV